MGKNEAVAATTSLTGKRVTCLYLKNCYQFKKHKKNQCFTAFGGRENTLGSGIAVRKQGYKSFAE